MEPIRRAENGHRCYEERDLEWINLLKHLHTTGMTIADMQKFADLMREGDAGIPGRRQLLEEHGMRVEQQMKQLQQTLLVIQGKITHYRTWEAQIKKTEKQDSSL